MFFGHKLGTFIKFWGTFWDHSGTIRDHERQDEFTANPLIYKGF